MRVQRGESFCGNGLSRCRHLSLLLTFNRNKHLRDKPRCSVVVCFVHLLLSPPQSLLCLRVSLVSGVLAGATLLLGLLPPARLLLVAPARA